MAGGHGTFRQLIVAPWKVDLLEAGMLALKVLFSCFKNIKFQRDHSQPTFSGQKHSIVSMIVACVANYMYIVAIGVSNSQTVSSS